MNSTTDLPETAHTFDPSSFTVVPARTFEDLRVGENAFLRVNERHGDITPVNAERPWPRSQLGRDLPNYAMSILPAHGCSTVQISAGIHSGTAVHQAAVLTREVVQAGVGPATSDGTQLED